MRLVVGLLLKQFPAKRQINRADGEANGTISATQKLSGVRNNMNNQPTIEAYKSFYQQAKDFYAAGDIDISAEINAEKSRII